MKRVAVFGGGIAGLTAAHELAARGYRVDVFERGPGAHALGGKARTQYFRDPTTSARLPGEHGFRFFPSFYTLVPDTMRRIPWRADEADVAAALQDMNDNVAQRLVPTSRWGLAREGRRLASFPRRPPASLPELAEIVEGIVLAFGDVAPRDAATLARKLLHYYTRGDVERGEVYERMSFWDYVGGDAMGPRAQHVLVQTPKTLVAMDAREGNARTLLNLLFLMGTDFARRGQASDRVLDGPTSETWIDPWVRWLQRLGVRFHFGDGGSLHALALDDGRIVGAVTEDGMRVEADEVVLALPAEALQRVIWRSGLARHDARLARVAQLDMAAITRWMIGVQLYLAHDQPMLDGHLGFCDSAWGLTCVSQGQYWSPSRMQSLASSAGVRGVVSVIATEWHRTAGASGRVASRCSADEVLDEVTRQIARCRGRDGRPLLDPDEVVARHLDQDTARVHGRITGTRAPLLIHPPGLWHFRPTAATRVRGLTLCSDFVRNDLDLATMEGANLAARLAVNDVLARDGWASADQCRTHRYLETHEPRWLRTLKRRSDDRYLSRRRRGLVPQPAVNAALRSRIAPPVTELRPALPPLAAAQ